MDEADGEASGGRGREGERVGWAGSVALGRGGGLRGGRVVG